MTELFLWLAAGLQIVIFILLALIYRGIVKVTGSQTLRDLAQSSERLEKKADNLRVDLNKDMTETVHSFGSLLVQTTQGIGETQNKIVAALDKNVADKLETSQKTLFASLTQVEQRLQAAQTAQATQAEQMRQTVERRLTELQADNNKKLEEMRQLVDEKLQRTLNERMTESFKLVNDRLEQVYKGLGEMRLLAEGVGDLKKVLTNVKTRGILGEIQLGAILEEILAPEQYVINAETKKGSGKVVEYAVKLPSEDGNFIYLPIDAKFPGDTYANLKDAYEKGNQEEINVCAKVLVNTLKAEARDIHDKYLDPPHTTEFALLFLPFEGLYAEVVNRGLIEILQRDYQVNIAGPSTMAALLNSLQMDFRTFAIQQRSGEVWKVLGAVRTEFDKFADALQQTQTRLNQANEELDKLVGTRTRKMQVKLRSLSRLSSEEAEELLELKQDEGKST